MYILRQIFLLATYATSTAVSIWLIVAVPLANWQAAKEYLPSDARLRSHFVVKDRVDGGQRVHLENLQHTVSYLTSRQGVAYKSHIVGKFAKRTIEPGEPLNAMLVSEQQGLWPEPQASAITFELPAAEATGIVPNMRIALVRQDLTAETGGDKGAKTSKAEVYCYPRYVCDPTQESDGVQSGLIVMSRLDIGGDTPTVALTIEIAAEYSGNVADIAINDWQVIILGGE